ncbi:hypothetical protein, partial [Streptomyces sp. McG6]|uniref:hypothetical protein n=1 Tax=Streptomyces sp. McG6 TaxID=2725485 RepID=UPI001BE651C5
MACTSPVSVRAEATSTGVPESSARATARTETGGTIGVTYSDAECSARAPVKLPASPHTNTMRCYPQFWT